MSVSRFFVDSFMKQIYKMSTIPCEIIGTGDGEVKEVAKNECVATKSIANDIVLEIVDNALDLVDDNSVLNKQKRMDNNPFEEYKKDKRGDEKIYAKEKPTSLIGTGDQKSNEAFEPQEPTTYHPPVEKKNRLTDLVKNSKQLLAKIIMSDSKVLLQAEKKEDEKVMEVIELDCVQLSDIPYKKKIKMSPETIPLPKNDSHEILEPPPTDDSMVDIGLNSSTEEPKKEEVKERKRMTFPRASGSKAKAAFAAKCRTLKREATNLKKKKWDVSNKIVNFFRKKRSIKDDGASGSKSTQVNQHNFEKVDEVENK
ncbi:uncharacterized protein LOC126734367 [Anthonomus grandis grandis]|uniref:uncharacterized protein LOC126734367 n=1 Tax=Anthonomus grandis grandis TaxID=2921223 RepID=UPI0021659DA8|nr:uncharacterized protein LOC126734367 [Anthonomus grandis grandis]